MGDYSFAPLYDVFLYPFINGLRVRNLKIIQRLKPNKIIDICCGTGNQLKLLKKHGFDVIGVDLSKEMLAISKKGKYSPKCFFMDATNTYFDKEFFDLAIITFALHEKQKEQAEAMLAEAHRILKKGGYLIITDFIINKKTFFLSKYIISFIESRAGKQHFANFKAYIQYGGLNTLIDKKNFTNIETYYLAFHGITIEVWKIL